MKLSRLSVPSFHAAMFNTNSTARNITISTFCLPSLNCLTTLSSVGVRVNVHMLMRGPRPVKRNHLRGPLCRAGCSEKLEVIKVICLVSESRFGLRSMVLLETPSPRREPPTQRQQRFIRQPLAMVCLANLTYDPPQLCFSQSLVLPLLSFQSCTNQTRFSPFLARPQHRGNLPRNL